MKNGPRPRPRMDVLLTLGFGLLLGALALASCVSNYASVPMAITTPIPQTRPPTASNREATDVPPTHAPRADPSATLPPPPALNATLVEDGRHLYLQHCASCHGANLEGQPHWKTPLPDGKFPAPPHDDFGHTWHHPDALLYRIIFEGGNGDRNAQQTGMPMFRDQLSGRDAVAIMSYIKSNWSQINREYQWEMSVSGH